MARSQQFQEEFSVPLNQPVDYGFVPARRVAATSAIAQRAAQKAKTATFAPAHRPGIAMGSAGSHETALRVAERLATLMEIHRLVADGLLDLPLDEAMRLAAGSPLLSEQQVVAAAAVAPPRSVAPPPMAAPPPVATPPAVAAPPLHRASPPPTPARRPVPPAPAEAVAASTPPSAALSPRQPVHPPSAVSAGQSRVSEDVYALYGFDEISTVKQPLARQDESSGEISVAA